MSSAPDPIDAFITSRAITAPSEILTEERRASERVPLRASVRLVGLGGGKPLPCTVADASAWGLFVHAPAAAGLKVGQRYEVTVSPRDATPELAGLRGEGTYATVVRTGRVSESPLSLIGAGMRFDQPLLD